MDYSAFCPKRKLVLTVIRRANSIGRPGVTGLGWHPGTRNTGGLAAGGVVPAVPGECDLMKPLSCTQRLAAGLGVIAVGICAAWPFRRLPEQAVVIPFAPAESGIALSADVALQLPGQPASVPEPSDSLSNWGSEPRQSEEPAPTAPPEALSLVPLPTMPDRFQPLQEQRWVAPTRPGVISEPPAVPMTARSTRRHRIHDGDTLESLALRYLDDEGRSHEIYTANQDVLSDPALLPIGAELVIPPADRGAEQAELPTQLAEEDHLVPLPAQFSRRSR